MQKRPPYLDVLDRGAEWLVAAIFGVMFVIALLQVFNRFVLNVSLSWSEEAQIFGHIWIVFLGIPIAYRRGAHLYIESYCDRYPPRVRTVFNLSVELMWLAFAVALVYLGWRVAEVAQMQESPGLQVPMSYPYYGLVVGGAYLLFVAACRIAGGAWKVKP